MALLFLFALSISPYARHMQSMNRPLLVLYFFRYRGLKRPGICV